MTRTTDLIPSVQERIVKALRAGNYMSVAARLGGVHRDTVYGWLERAKTGEQPFSDFSDAVEEAIAQGQADALAVVEKAAKGWTEKTTETIDNGDTVYSKERTTEKFDWHAASWFLEKRNPAEWGNRQKVEIELPGTPGIEGVEHWS